MNSLLLNGLSLVVGFILAALLSYASILWFDTEPNTSFSSNEKNALQNRGWSERKSGSYTDRQELLSKRVLTSALIELVNRVDESDLIALVSSFSDLHPEHLSNKRHLKDYIARLAMIALQDDVTLTVDQLVLDDIQFSSIGDSESLARNATGVFSSATARIFAWFDPLNFDGEFVYSRWIHKASGRIVLYNRLPIAKEHNIHHIWLEQQSWPVGTYQVDIYADDEYLGKIASGYFEIVGE